MSEFKKGPGRPRKEPVAYDSESTKDFISRLFEIQREIKVLQEDVKELKEEFKNKIDQKLVSGIVRLVKAKVAVENQQVSPDTIQEVEDLVRDKINIVVG